MALVVNYLTNPMDEIRPNLFLGSIRSLQKTYLNDIDTVISMTSDAFKYDLAGLVQNHYVFPVRDSYKDQVNMTLAMRMILPIIKDELRKGNTVLVHCKAGLHRAATVVVHYLQTTGLSAKQAVSLVQARRPLALWRKPFNLNRSVDKLV